MNKSNLIASRLTSAVVAGLLGITVNTLVLEAAPQLHINPGKGGLLQLFHRGVQHWMPSLLPFVSRLGLKQPPTLAGFLWFHYVTGLAMVLAYFFIFTPRLGGSEWWKSNAFSLFAWLINAAIVLPALGQGFAGVRSTPLPGAVYFFFANWLFVIVSALCYRALIGRHSTYSRRDT